MLRKLLKYDFRANMKIFLFVWPAILVFAVLEHFMLQANLDDRLMTILVNLTTMLYGLAIVAACVFALVISITRFYSGLLRDEGYLMFTLPVRPWQLIVSKFLTALVTISITVLLSILSLSLLPENPHIIVTDMFDGLDSILNVWGYILFALMVLLSLSDQILKIYLACAVGHLAKRKRIFFAVLFYYVLNVVLEVSFVALFVLVTANDTLSRLICDIIRPFKTAGGMSAMVLGVIDVILLIAGSIYFFVTERILRKHLNLE